MIPRHAESTKIPWLLKQPHRGGPDFVCIGAQKGGTRWLFDQLNHHPNFWMPPIKEIRYLDDGRRFRGRARRLRRQAKANLDQTNQARLERHDRPLTPVDIEWLTARLWLSGRPINFDWYACLFSPREDRLSGDISPPYALIDDAKATMARRNLPRTKFIYLARDPIDRLWSQYCMVLRRRTSDKTPSLPAVRRYVEGKQAGRHSSIRDVVRRWRLALDDPLFKVFFFDDLKRDSGGLFNDILGYLDAPPAPNADLIDTGYNRKKDRAKVPMTDDIRDYLVDFFADEIRGSADLLGGPAAAWPERYAI